MASRVTYENLFSESRNNVIALITTTNIPDSRISSTEFRKRIYSREPDVKKSDFAGYPYFIVNHTDVDIGEVTDRGSLDGKSRMVYWDIEVEIVTSDRGYGGKEGTGAADMDTYSNAFVKTFMNKTNRQTLRGNSMPFGRPTTTSVVPETRHGELCFVRTISLSFKSKIQVSA